MGELLENRFVASGEFNGYRWGVVVHHVLGSENGYVRLPDGHVWSRLTYDEINDIMEDLPHGGWTFKEGQWLGFDTAHYGDYWEGGSPLYQEFFNGDPLYRKVWTSDDLIL